ncbi:MAG: polysaccharide deacetylase family protein [Bacteroidia bacterium]|nr:polysaccharide deacetylase family protein [Bacteroidia bacterium]
MRIFRPFLVSGWLFPGALFRINTREKLLCITFDDGPNHFSTPAILKILDEHNVKALFFCKGENAELYPDLFQRIISEGHLAGNHCYSHPDGWFTGVKQYIADVEKASHYIPGRYFRPPFGRLRIGQYLKLRSIYKIVFWDIMPYDFDKSFSWEESLKVLLGLIRPGSVIALHDSEFSSSPLFLDRFIKEARGRGYQFVLPE